MTEGGKMVDVSEYRSGFTAGNRIARGLWGIVWILFFRFTPVICFAWRHCLLKLFGAKLGKGVHVYPSCRIWAPWNLEMGDYACLSHSVDCYNVGRIVIGKHATVSQYAFLCTATHDVTDPGMKLVVKPIEIGEGAWVCAKAYIAPGVKLSDGAVAGAGAVVTKDVPEWTVVGGNPAVFIKKRELKKDGDESA
jgi:putative colanic acid biosynthesis acetyltransferase WcaF